jgi:hypothetical protein
MELTLKTNFPDVLRQLNQLEEQVGSRALASAMNKTMDQAHTEVVRQITREFNVPRDYVVRRLRISRTKVGFSTFLLRATLAAGDGSKRRSANLIQFVERSVTLAEGRRRAKAGTQQQLFFQIKRAGGKKSKTGAFIGNKGRTVFERVQGTTMASRSKYAGSKHAEEIAPVQVIDVPQMFNTKRINKVVVERMLRSFPAVFEREARFYLQRFNASR